MKKSAPFILVLMISIPLHSCYRRPFNHRNHKIAAAIDFLTDRYRKNYNELSLFQTLVAASDALIQFFDTTHNKESFNKHVHRLHAFHHLIKSKLVDEEALKKDFENNAAEYRMEFGEFLTFKEFKTLMFDLNKHYDVFCHKLINQTINRSTLKICKIFYDFKNRLPERFFNRTNRLTGIEISSYKIWSVVRYRLSLKD